MTIQLTSPAFAEGTPIPMRYTCDGADLAPPLQWNGLPSGTRNLALLCEDPDAPRGVWVHWILYSLPSTIIQLSEGIPVAGNLDNGARQGINDFRRLGYGGPCPPGDHPHRYFFRLYALDKELDLPPGTDKSALVQAMEGHILARGQLMGTYRRR